MHSEIEGDDRLWTSNASTIMLFFCDDSAKDFKIPKISPEAYIFQRHFLRCLFLEGPTFGGAYVRREICISKSTGLACSGKEMYHFHFVLPWIQGQIPSTSPPGGLFSERRFNGGFFALRFSGAYTWRGLFLEFYGICRFIMNLYRVANLY